MVEILQNKNSATRFQILVEIASSGPSIQQKSIAGKLGATPQAISDYIHQLLDEELVISTGRSTYKVSTIGVNWMLKVLRELRTYSSLVEQAVTNITVCATIAECDIKQGRAVKKAVRRGMPVYAECGGLMYLGRNIRDLQGNEYPMVGAIPVSSQIDSPRLSLGYRTVRALGDGPILCQGEIVRGHEFHWSVLESNAGTDNAYRILGKDVLQEGFQKKKLLASYIHLHLGSLPSLPLRFVENCRRFRDSYNYRGTP